MSLALIGKELRAHAVTWTAAFLLSAPALVGDATQAGGNYRSFTNLSVNDAGQIAFSANLIFGSATSGLFSGTPGAFQTVALSGGFVVHFRPCSGRATSHCSSR